jgi:hypothetical protein
MKYIKLFNESIKYNEKNIYNKFPKELNYREMVDFIIEHNLRNSSGLIEYEEAKEIASATNDKWKLVLLKLKNICDWEFKNPYKTDISIPALVYKHHDNTFEVLDGKTRLGYLNYIGIENVYVYLAN